MAKISIRKYRRRDRERVLRIAEESFAGVCLDENIERHFGRIAGTNWRERKRESIDYDLRHNPQHALVAEADGEVIGFVALRIYPDQLMGHIANLAVAREWQGQGAGKMLLNGALAHLRECGMRYARIETLEQNFKAQKLYPAFGFQEIGRQIHYLRVL